MDVCEECKYYHDNCNAKFRCRLDLEKIRADAIDEYNSKIKEVCKIVGSCDFESLDMLANELKETKQ